MSAEAPIDTAKVSAIKEAISRGDYPVDLDTDALLQAYSDIKKFSVKNFIQSLEQMEASFNSDAKNVKECSQNVDIALCDLKIKKHRKFVKFNSI